MSKHKSILKYFFLFQSTGINWAVEIYFIVLCIHFFFSSNNTSKKWWALQSDVPSTRRRDVEEQVFPFRTLIRKKVYLLHPSDPRANLMSLDGKLLSKERSVSLKKALSLRASSLTDTWDLLKTRTPTTCVFALQKKKRHVFYWKHD